MLIITNLTLFHPQLISKVVLKSVNYKNVGTNVGVKLKFTSTAVKSCDCFIQGTRFSSSCSFITSYKRTILLRVFVGLTKDIDSSPCIVLVHFP